MVANYNANRSESCIEVPIELQWKYIDHSGADSVIQDDGLFVWLCVNRWKRVFLENKIDQSANERRYP